MVWMSSGWSYGSPGCLWWVGCARVQVRHLFELHIYTLGTKPYAAEMARILDPTGELFQGRIISKGIDSIRDLDARTSHAGGATGAPLGPDGLHMLSADEVTKLERRVLHHSKDLEGVLGMENAVLILDDTANVWPHHFRNLIQVERWEAGGGCSGSWDCFHAPPSPMGRDPGSHSSALLGYCVSGNLSWGSQRSSLGFSEAST